MKKSLTLLVSFLTLTVLGVGDAQAQSASQPDNSLSLSPAIQIIQESDLGQTFELKITNNTGADVILTPELSGVVRNESGTTVPVDQAPQNIIDFETEPFTVADGEVKRFPVRVRLTFDTVDTFPAITFSAASAGGDEQVGLNTSLVSVFLVQNVSGSLGIDSDFSLNQPGIAFQPDLTVSGSVRNTGDKFFNPSGSVIVSREGQIIFEEEITTQISGLLFPDESKEFSVSWSLEGSFPENTGNYDVEIRLTPNPFEQTHVTKSSMFYIPLEVMVVGVPVVIVVISLTGYLLMRKNKRKSS